MIYLYVKTHNKTGLKYLGKTTAKDPHDYKGSGKHWKAHIKKHGYDVETKILLKTDSEEALKETGFRYSKKWNIVKSKKWANLTEETGNGISSEFSKRLQKKRVKDGTHPWLNGGTADNGSKTRERNIQAAKDGTHPFLGGKYVKESNKRMVDNGIHPFQDKEKMKHNRKRVSETQRNRVEEGKHNFKGKLPVIDKKGNTSIISKEDYLKNQIGSTRNWKYVSTSSKEARSRRICQN